MRLISLYVGQTETGGQPVVVFKGACLGGTIRNPYSAVGQTIPVAETLIVSLAEGTTPFILQPGQDFTIPAGFDGTVTVVSSTGGHSFAGFVAQPDFNYQPLVGLGETGQPFPPADITVLSEVIPAYLYQQYTDDDDLQAFVGAFNDIANRYADWFARTNPADYTQEHVAGILLDWVAAGLYGMVRPALPTGQFKTVGPLNTYVMNGWPLNVYSILPPADFQLTSDDTFRRILTWHLYKDDGDVFDVRWLKRRVKRFLSGDNGTAGQTDHTYEVSVTFGSEEVAINLQRTRRFFKGGALFNAFMLNTMQLNQFDTTAVVLPVNPLGPIFKAAVDAGVLELPFQYHFVVNISD